MAINPPHKRGHRDRTWTQRGNVFFTLFGAVAVLGVLGAGIMATMRGPLTTMVEVKRRTQAESEMEIASKLIMLESVSAGDAGDCDADGFVEPLEFKTSTKKPTGGGVLPDAISSQKMDPWGTAYGYCVWNAGRGGDSDTADGTSCGDASENRLEGKDDGTTDYVVMAIVSAGPDKTFSTTCSEGPPDVSRSGDDILKSYTYESAAAASDGLWKLKIGDPTVAEIDKDIEAQGAKFTGDVDLSDVGASAQLKLGARSLLLPTNVELANGDCDGDDPANNYLIRINTATTPDTVEICDNAAGGWRNVAQGSSYWQEGAEDDEIFYSAGNVGIGTDNPEYALDIRQGAHRTYTDGRHLTYYYSTETTPRWQLKSPGYGSQHSGLFFPFGGAAIGNAGNGTNSITISTGSTLVERMRINNSGVGIGDISPDAALEVVGDLFVSSTDAGEGDRFIVTNTGNVGIGDPAPGDKLDVVGNIDTTANYMIDDSPMLSNAGSVTNILLGNVNAPSAATNYMNLGDVIHVDLVGDNVGIGFGDTWPLTGLNDTLEVNGTADIYSDTVIGGFLDVAGNIDGGAGLYIASSADIGVDLTVGNDATIDGTLEANDYTWNGNDFTPPTCGGTEYVSWDGDEWVCRADTAGGGGGGGAQTLEETLNAGNDANGRDALDFNDIGADQYCDAAGTNCFTATDIAGGAAGLWSKGAGDIIYYNSGTPKVGIGTASPQGSLQINNSSGFGDIIFEDGANYYSVGYQGTKLAFSNSVYPNINTAMFLSSDDVHLSDTTNLYGTGEFNVERAVNQTKSSIHIVSRGVVTSDSNSIFKVTGGGSYTTQQIAFLANGGAIFNDEGNDADFRVEGNTDTSLVFVDASIDAVGIGTTTPSSGTGGQLKLDVEGNIGAIQYCDEDGDNCFAATDVADAASAPGTDRQIIINDNGAFGASDVVITAGSSAGAGGDIATGLVAHYEFETGSGGTATDSAGGNDGTLNGDPTWVAGKVGSNALDFDGSDDYIALANPTVGSAITVAGWANFDVTGLNTIFSISDVNTTHPPVLLRLSGSNANFFMDTADGVAQITGSTTLSTGQWYHVVGVYDGSDLKIYLNGVSDGAPIAQTGNIDSPDNTKIGAWHVNGSPSQHMNGQLDDVRIYSRALSATDIAKLYEIGEPPASGGSAIGIGDTTPDGDLRLDVAGNIGAEGYCDEDGDNCFTATDVADSANLWQENSSDIYYNSGNVGIGTDSPGANLDIKSDFSNSPLRVVDNGDIERFSYNIGNTGYLNLKAKSPHSQSIQIHPRGVNDSTAIEFITTEPKYRFTGNTGLATIDVKAINNPLNFLTVGNITYASYFPGIVGINTTTPSSGTGGQLKLDVEGAIGATNYCDEDGDNCFTAAGASGIIASGGGLWTASAGTDSIYYTSGTPLVGIGTDSPSAALNVVGASTEFNYDDDMLDLKFTSDTHRNNTSGTDRQNFGMSFIYENINTDGVSERDVARIHTNINPGTPSENGNSSTPAAALVFSTLNGGAGQSLEEKMRIQGNGNVGIGTDSPSAVLDVIGDIRVGSTAQVRLYRDGNGAVLQDTAGGAVALKTLSGWPLYADNSLKTHIAGGTAAQGTLQVSDGPAASMVINASGNVGIGTTAPGAQLEVKASGDDAIYIRNNANTLLYDIGQSAAGVARFRMRSGGATNIQLASQPAVPTYFNAGDVVIGDTTASGTLKLDIEGPVGASQYCDADGNNCFTAAGASGIIATGGGLWTASAGTDSIYYNSGSSKVGIGTDAPGVAGHDTKLHLVGSGSGTAGRTQLAIKNTSADSASQIFLENADGHTATLQISGSSYIGGAQAGFGVTGTDLAFVTDGDMGTGGTHDIYFQTGGWNTSNRFVVYTSDKTVGIGDLTPDTGTGGQLKLDVEGPVGATQYCDADGNNCFTAVDASGLIASGGGLWTASAGTDSIYYNSGTPKVGIGTDDPLVTMHLKGNPPRLYLEETDSGSYWNISNHLSVLRLSKLGTLGNEISIYNPTSSYENASMTIGTDVLISAGDSSYFNGGNVGIGTDSPNAPLHVMGSYGVTVQGSGTNVSGGIIQKTTANGGQNWLLAVAGGGGVIAPGNSWYLYDQTASEARIVVTDTTGSVGLGTTTPSSGTGGQLKLDVEGNVGATNYCNEDGDNCFTAADASEILATGGGLWTASAGTDSIYYTSGTPMVGIGTDSPEFTYSESGASGLNIKSMNPAIRLTGQVDGSVGFMEFADESDAVQYMLGYRDSTNTFKIVPGNNITSATGISMISSGNVGIGTTSPGQKLSVIGDVIISDSPTAALFFNSDGDGVADSGDPVIYKNGSKLYIGRHSVANSLTITNTDTIGIGDDTPDGTLKLDVEGPVGATQYCDADGNNCFTAADASEILATGGGLWTASAGTDSIYFNSGTPKVGIGTDSPNALLTTNLSSTVANQDGIKLTLAGNDLVDIGEGIATNYGGMVTLHDGGSAGNYFRMRYDAGYPKLETNRNGMTFITLGGPQMRLASTYTDLTYGSTAIASFDIANAEPTLKLKPYSVGQSKVFSIIDSTDTENAYILADGQVGAVEYCDADGNNCFTAVDASGLIATGGGLWTASAGTDSIYYNSGTPKVGIGTDSPTHSLTIANVGSMTLYNTADQATNYERTLIGWDSDVFKISGEKSGTGSPRKTLIESQGELELRADAGATNKMINFRVNSTTPMTIYSGFTQVLKPMFSNVCDQGPELYFDEAVSGTNPTMAPRRCDGDTGIGSSVADSVSLIAGGVNVLNAASSGNVGIGTTSPDAKLDIAAGTLTSSNANAVNITGVGYRGDSLINISNTNSTDGNSGFYYPAGITALFPNLTSNKHMTGIATGTAYSQRNSAALGFVSESSGSTNNYGTLGLYGVDAIITFNGSGNVGIGTTTPSSGTGGQLKLDVEGPVGATQYCDVDGDNCFTAADASGIIATGGGLWTASSGTDSIYFNSGTPMVGIGTDSPSAAVHIKEGNLYIENSVDGATASPSLTQGIIKFNNTYDSSGSNTTANKIIFFQNSFSRYGMGLSGGRMNFFTGSGGGYRFFTSHVNESDPGSEIFTILTAGTVGIGTTTPSSGTGGQLSLDVEGPVGATQYCDADGNNCFTAADASGLLSGASGLWLASAGTDSIYYNSGSPKVGIGTDNPQGILEISSTDAGNVVDTFRLSNLSIDVGTGTGIVFTNSTNAAFKSAGIYSSRETTVAVGNLRFYTRNATAFAERMRISYEGNVGIGTTTPSSGTGGQLKLDVEGNVGAVNYCDEDGDNCFTAADVGSGETEIVTGEPAPAALNVDDLGDVDAASPSTNDVLTWDGSDWIAQAVGSSSLWTASSGTDSIYYNSGTPLVGIGTDSPQTPLQVGDNSGGTFNMRIDGALVSGHLDNTRRSYINFSGNPMALVNEVNGNNMHFTIRTSGGSLVNSLVLSPTVSSAAITAMPTVAGQVALTIKGAASQSANLTEWQDSAGTALSYVRSSGNLVVPQGTAGATTTSIQNAAFPEFGLSYHGNNKLSLSRNTTPLWETGQNGADGYFTIGTSAQLGFSSSGTFGSLGVGDVAIKRNAAGIVEVNNGTAGQWSALRIGTQAAATQPLMVKGAASQTANLTEWQDSSGAVLAKVDSAGSGTFYGLTTQSNASTGGYLITQGGLYTQGFRGFLTSPGADLSVRANGSIKFQNLVGDTDAPISASSGAFSDKVSATNYCDENGDNCFTAAGASGLIASGGGLWSASAGTDSIYYTSGTPKVGIGTDSPSAALDVAGDVEFHGIFKSNPSSGNDVFVIDNSGPSATGRLTIAAGGAHGQNLTIEPRTNSNHTQIRASGSGALVLDAPLYGSLILRTGQATYSNALIIGATGNVGIGTTSPSSGTGGQLKLDVAGNVGAVNYCDEDGDNCFTAADVAGGSSLWTASSGTDSIYFNSGTPLVGIGTDSPESTLTVNGGSLHINKTTGNYDTPGGAIILNRNGTIAASRSAGIFLYGDDYTGTETQHIAYSFKSNGDPITIADTKFVMTSGGRLGIGITTPNYTLDVAGDINYSGSLSNVSDVRLKDGIEPLSEFVGRGSKTENRTLNTEAPLLDRLMQINTYKYAMKVDETHRTRFGVIAQELEQVFPELVNTQDDGYKSVNYVELIPPMIEATKELKAENDMLRAELNAMKGDITALKRHTGFGVSHAAFGLLMIIFGGAFVLIWRRSYA